MNIFVTGIGTNVGKTIISSILTEALQADYWKPVQSGVTEGKDSEIVRDLLSNPKSIIHPEAYLLKEPLSPHFAAELENVEIEMDRITLPNTSNTLLIEGAGGLLVPINQTHYVIDIAKKMNCEICLVISSYLGCINHSLLSINYLLQHQYPIHSLVFNGEFAKEIQQLIIQKSPKTRILNIPILNSVSKKEIAEIATFIKPRLL